MQLDFCADATFYFRKCNRMTIGLEKNSGGMDLKAALVYGDGRITVEDVPELVPGPHQALVKILACSICNGSDRKIIQGEISKEIKYPAVLGHEGVGEVVEVGTDVKAFQPGDRVFHPGAFFPPEVGLDSRFGGFAQYGFVTDRTPMEEQSFPPQIIDKEIDPVEAAVLITYKETLSWLQNFNLTRGESLFIWGTGPVAYSFALNAKIMGAYPVIVAGRRDDPIPLLKKSGADYVINAQQTHPLSFLEEILPGGVDKVIEAAGDYNLIQPSLSLLKPHGEIGIYGIPPAAEKNVHLNLASFPRRASLRFVDPNLYQTHRQVLEYYRLGFIKPKNDISHVLPLLEIDKAFQLLKEKKAFKVVIRMD